MGYMKNGNTYGEYRCWMLMIPMEWEHVVQEVDCLVDAAWPFDELV